MLKEIKNWEAIKKVKLRYDYRDWSCEEANDWTDVRIEYKNTFIIYRCTYVPELHIDKDPLMLFLYVCSAGYVEVKTAGRYSDNKVIYHGYIDLLNTESPKSFIKSLENKLVNP